MEKVCASGFRRWAIPLVFSGFILFAAATWGAPRNPTDLVGVDAKWHYLNSAHFEIYSHQSDRKARELLHNLEILRAIFFNQLKLNARIHVDVTIYAFGSQKEFLAYAPKMFEDQSEMGGFHQFQSDRAVIVLPPADDDEAAQQTIFHEYVHHLFRIAEDDPPLWFNEGTADIFGGMRVERERVLIGTPFQGRVSYLQGETLLPLDQLFAADQSSKIYIEERHTGVFYAESWAFVHYLHFGDNGFSKDAVDKFLNVALNREKLGQVDLAAHFRACFGCDYQEMGTRLRRYIMSGKYRAYGVPMPKLPPESSYPVRDVSIEETKLRLAELSVRVLQSGAGELVLLNDATAPKPDPRAFEALGAEAAMKGDNRAALQRWEQALTAGSKNPAILRELALLEGRTWFQEFNPNLILPDDVGERLRERLKRSIEMEPAQGASYEMLVWVEAFSRLPDTKNIHLILEHIGAITDKRHTFIGLTHLMIRLGQTQSAENLFRTLDQVHLEPPDMIALQQLHGEFDAVKNELAASGSKSTDQPTSPSAMEGKSEPVPPHQAAQAPSVAVPDDL